MLGSTSIELEIAEAGGGPARTLRLLFSGDIGPGSKLLHPDPEAPYDLDYVICELTYGDRDRPEAGEETRRDLLREEVLAARNPDGALLIPSFAVERAQELISDLTRLMAEGALPEIPIHVDSPLASKATRIFARHARELEGGASLVAGLRSGHVRFTETVEQSKALDRTRGFHIVIAASGMCEAGRIRHRLKNWIWRDEATVLFVGYQAAGTLGRILVDGARSVRIQGDEFAVRARIRSIDLYSGHADGPELAEWVRKRRPIRNGVFLTHGEEPAIAGLAARLDGIVDAAQVVTPVLDESYDLNADGARRLAGHAPRLAPEKIARLDWHNDVTRLILDVNDALAAAPDERTRQVLIRRLRRALEDESAGAAPV